MGLKRIAGTRGGRVGGERTGTKICALARRRGRCRKGGRLHAQFSIKSRQTSMIHRLLVTRGNQGCHESCGPVIGFSSKDVAGFIALKMEGSPQKERNSQKVPFGIKRCTFWNQVNLCRRHKCLHPTEQVRESRTTVSDRKGRDGPCWSRARAHCERLHGSRGGHQRPQHPPSQNAGERHLF